MNQKPVARSAIACDRCYSAAASRSAFGGCAEAAVATGGASLSSSAEGSRTLKREPSPSRLSTAVTGSRAFAGDDEGGCRFLAVGEGCDECIDLLLIRTLAPGVDARTCRVADPEHDLLGSRRVMDQHRGRIEGIEIPIKRFCLTTLKIADNQVEIVETSECRTLISAANPKFALQLPRVRLRTSGSKRH
jgi:hypothetical protein